MNNIKDLPVNDRPYEKCFAKGPEYLTDVELLAVILRTGTNGISSFDLSKDILSHKSQNGKQDLLAIMHMTKEQLLSIKGVGMVKAVQIMCVRELVRRISSVKAKDSIQYNIPSTIADYYMEQLRHLEQENLVVMFLDTKCHLIKDMTITKGTVNQSLISSREIFVEALRCDAVNIILIHNHPSGDCTPSRDDMASTLAISKAGKIIGINVLDHIIIGDRIDFGTSTIKIYNGLTKTVITEKDIIAIKNKTQLFEFGDEALKMYEKTPPNINIIFPIKYGVIADLKNMKLLFESFYKKITKASGSKMGRFCIAVPTDITEVEKRAFYDVVAKSDIKAREIKIVEKPIADAVGLQIDMNSQKGNLIVNIGADTTEISVISMGGIVVSRIIKLGGNNIDQMICDVVKRRYNIYIGLRTAEKIKIALADAIYSEDENNEDDILYVFGRNVITGLPSERAVAKDTICEAIKLFFDEMVDSIKTILERTPPELSADILETGMYLTGGSASIRNLDKLIAQETDLKVNTVKNPEASVIRGISLIVSDSQYKKLMYEPKQSSF